jgi:hypothetical protein
MVDIHKLRAEQRDLMQQQEQLLGENNLVLAGLKAEEQQLIERMDMITSQIEHLVRMTESAIIHYSNRQPRAPQRRVVRRSTYNWD